MAYKVCVTNGFNIVKDVNVARQLIEDYRLAGIYTGMQFLPWYNGDECWK